MKTQLLLTGFGYSIPSSAMALACLKDNHIFAEHLPLMKVDIDFINGHLVLEGNWQFMMASNKHNQEDPFCYHRERVKIEATIIPAFPIDLNDPSSDGLMFSMQGNINDGVSICSCIGLFIVDSVAKQKGSLKNQWNISFYLYDLRSESSEIVFKLPVYI